MTARSLCLIVAISCLNIIFCQQNEPQKMVEYTTDYKFTDGIFLYFDQVKTNTPLPKTRIITTVNYDHPQFFDILLNNKQISYYDNLGQQNSLLTKDIWGYANNGVLYIKNNNSFSRITLVGSISHFVSSYTTYNTTPSVSYGNPYYSSTNNYPSTEMRQYILDFSTGKVYDYTVENLMILFMKDTELYDEYNSLRKKKKRQQKFIFLRKFNERNPLMVPVR